MRYFIEISYHGTAYHGWQIQPDAITVQEVLEQTLTTFFRNPIHVMGAGRTDSGVHAKQLFAHFDFDKIENIDKVLFKLNSFLPSDISVVSLREVKEDAHARFDATAREYEYHISLKKDPFAQGLAYQLYQQPDVTLMNEAAKVLLTHTDFQCFSRSNTDVKTYYCSLKKAVWTQTDHRLVFTIEADRFLRNMVRAIVGTMLDIGFGKIDINELHTILGSKDRKKAGASAAAHGLYLVKVTYPESIFKTQGTTHE